jgi:DNA polymerase III alpha subunit
MRLDPFSNPVFNEDDLFRALYKGYGISSEMFVDRNEETEKLMGTLGIQCWLPLDNYDFPLEEYDASMQSAWTMPDEYANMDIEGFLISQCPKENYQRLMEELQEFRSRKMIDLLRWLKYFVDTCETHNIVSGVGRGSSVASYVLYILKVHHIDPIKYNLDWREFLR